MTNPIPPVGTPDWLNPTPVINTPLFDNSYDSGVATSLTLADINVITYSRIILIWKPDQNQQITVRQKKVNGAFTLGNPPKTASSLGGVFAFFEVRAALGIASIFIQPLVAGTAHLTGTLTVIGVNSTLAQGGIIGVTEIIHAEGVAVAAGQQLVLNGIWTLEGPANAYFLASDATAWVNITQYDAPSATPMIGRLNTVTANKAVMQSLWLPCRTCRVVIGSDSAAAFTAYFSLVVGG